MANRHRESRKKFIYSCVDGRSSDNTSRHMKAKALKELARDPRFIPGIYNYCDRWCERCPLSNRCLNYAMEKRDDDGDPAGRNLANEQFWQQLQGTFRETIEMIRADAKERGIDLDDRSLQAEAVAQDRQERRLAAKNRPLAQAAMRYLKATDEWFKNAKWVFQAKGLELEKLARLEVGDPGGAAAELQELVEVIRWYQHFIYVKLCRAIESKASEELETDEELRSFPRDSDGSAKIALIAVDRSISAWSALRSALGEDESDIILDLLVQLAAIRRETEKLFLRARAFVRPGFDTSG
jgi:hypothetical protein